MRKAFHAIAILIIVALIPFFLGMLSAHAETLPAQPPAVTTPAPPVAAKPVTDTTQNGLPIKMLIRSAWPLKANEVTDLIMHLWTDAGPVTPDQLQTFRDKKLHLMLLSSDFKEYFHTNPVPTSTPGEYRTSILARRKAGFRGFLEFATNEGVKHAAADMNFDKPTIVPLTGQQAPVAELGGYQFVIDFSHTLEAGKPNTGMVQVIHKTDYTPVTTLEPIFGAFGYVAAFGGDYISYFPATPIGPAPKDATARGGPRIQFEMTPTVVGLMQVYAQMRLEGKDVTVPFVVRVVPPASTVKSRDLENLSRPEYQDLPGK